MKKIAVLLALVIAIILTGIAIKSKRQNNSEQAQKPTKSSERNLMRSDERAHELSAKSYIPMEHMNPRLVALLEGYDSGDAERLKAIFLESLEKDEAGTLAALQHLDGLVSSFGLSAPEADIAGWLLEKYGDGSDTMELLASLPQVSTTVRNVMAQLLVLWGRKDINDVMSFVRENENFNDPVMFMALSDDQALKDGAAALAGHLSKLPESDPRKELILDQHFGRWVEHNPTQFAEYVNTLEDTSVAKNAISVYAITSAKNDIGAAFEWVDSIKDPDVRANTEAGVAVQYALQQPEQFEQWVAKKQFASVEEKDAYIDQIRSVAEETRNYTPSDIQHQDILTDIFKDKKK